jgi:hypothetical protein
MKHLMPGGSVVQARRRSIEDEDSDVALGSTTTLKLEGGGSLQLITPVPNQDELKSELTKRRCLNLSLVDKLKTIVGPTVEERDFIVETAKKTNPPLAAKISQVIPIDLPKKAMGPQVAALIVTIHSALQTLVEATTRSSCQVLKVFDKFDLAVKTAI